MNALDPNPHRGKNFDLGMMSGPDVREWARERLLELSGFADDDVMQAELEGLASRFSLPPGVPA